MSDTKKKGKATDIDVAVGENLRTLRKSLGWSQSKLAERAGVTFQQVQKYENGSNRVSASRLVDFAVALGVAVQMFFPVKYRVAAETSDAE